MKANLDIDADVLAAAKRLAIARGSTTGKVLSDLARAVLTPKEGQPVVRNGVPLLMPRPDSRPATLEEVNRLRDDSRIVGTVGTDGR